MTIKNVPPSPDANARPPQESHDGQCAFQQRRYVMHKHDATQLHYDLRLELDGALKSWAIPRGPSLHPDQRRLAVQVEDHALDYGGFEGTIPKDRYGAGTVMVWDHGTWAPVGDPNDGFARGSLEFRLLGEKLTGLWKLVRMKGKLGDKRKNWLLIKHNDEAARKTGDILQDAPRSVKSGRDLSDISAQTSGQ